ncbi:hypothetical protein SLEP1_g27643 [Rubroshorea leprosula]|uniref:EF-hand domain-containing protein n=1 Tax=Rubroshorea leprosula TaxID=152421 RepID=A0AAV5K0F3_9ROSI|nr:hypothetical protein SLEP1_g27643 [Rubroshorea leprosula]
MKRDMETIISSILFPAFLFIAGLLSLYFYFPTKKIYSWVKSFFSNSSTLAAVSPPTTSPQVSFRKRSGDGKKVELKRIFSTFDKNGDGFITKEELKESLKNMRFSTTEKEVEEMVVKVDANGDGLIDFDEFCILYEAMVCCAESTGEGGGTEVTTGGGEEELKEAFDVFDQDKDGLISVEELRMVLCSLGLNEGKKMEDCKAMIKKVDMDGDGMVNFDEFKRMMKGGELITAF